MHTTALKKDFAEKRKDSRGRSGPAGKTYENQEKILQEKENIFKQFFLSFLLCHLRKCQGLVSNKSNLQAYSVLKQVDQQTVKCFLVHFQTPRGLCFIQ